MLHSTIHLLLAGSCDHIEKALVVAYSAKIRLKNNNPICLHYIYINDKNNDIKKAQNISQKLGIKIFFYNAEDYMHLLKGQNIGYWGTAISLTHYLYLLAEILLPNSIEKVIFLDTDMIVNTDLDELWQKTNVSNKAIVLATPHGYEIFPDMPNTGFVIINLKYWRENNLLQDLLEFGKTVIMSHLCDQNLIYRYFVQKHSDLILYIEKEYNILPAHFENIPISEMKILHFTGYKILKPWDDPNKTMRGSDVWWEIYNLYKNELQSKITNF